MIHAASETTSKIVSKSISKTADYHHCGRCVVDEGAHGCKSHVRCDAPILDDGSRAAPATWRSVSAMLEIGHEATVSKIADEQLFYLMSRGLSQEQAMSWSSTGSSSWSLARCRWSTRWSGAA